MKTRLPMMQVAPLVAALFLLNFGFTVPVATAATTTYGTLDNFDVVNDTGGVCHGFEIELEGISPADVAYTFGAPYQRYGDPTIVPTASGVIIRYAASYVSNAWSAATPTGASYPPTDGHSCWEGGDPNYPNTGCDHFGASLNATPTKTTYRWLVESSTTPGTLTAFGSNVPIPAPVWNVTPPAVPEGQPVAAVAIAPPASEDPSKCGDALWAKVYVTELPEGLEADDLDHMVIDDPNVNIVPGEGEVEIEWVLLQACPENDGEQEFGGAAEVGAGNEAVSRRFEFYKYTGQYDPDPEGINEARCDNPLEAGQQIPERCGTPDSNGVAGVGELIGRQNVAINLAGPVVVNLENHAPVANPDSAGTNEDVALTISGAALLGNDTDRDGDPRTITSVQDASGGTVLLSGADVVFTPTKDFNGPASFTYTISDGNGGTSTGTVSVAVAPVSDPPIANAGADQSVRFHATVNLDGRGSSDADNNPLTYGWSFIERPARSKAALNGATTATPTFVADKAGTYVVQLVVSDGTGESATDTVTINATKGKP